MAAGEHAPARATPRPDLMQRLAAEWLRREQAQLLRRVRTCMPQQGAWVLIDGQLQRDFSSNDYLGLARDPALVAALTRAAHASGVGAGAAHLLGGHRDEHAQLEAALAQWTGRERALLFSTGYMANLGVLAGLLEAGDLCVQDKLNHASLIDGARLSGATLRRYRHADVESAARQLASLPQAAALLATDGVFSMDGDVAPLAQLASLCAGTGALMLVDDAHGLGVFGADGAGSLAEAGLGQTQVPLLMGTLGKALGCFGAFVAGPAMLIEALVQGARSYIYTTALPPALAAATLTAVAIARSDHERRARLHARIAQFRDGARTLNFPVLA
ncbi:MAG: 8-amino-7-oxononanoate synthase, partial [Dokdonella sp.]